MYTKNKNIKQNKNKENIKKQNKNEDCKIEARPEADTGDETHIEEQTTEQNIVFAEENPGEDLIVPSIMDPIRDVPMSNDATLAEFFKRPVLIEDLTWNDGDSLFSTFNPWEKFMSDKRVANRIANFKLGKGTLCVKLVLNGTPFHYGTGIMEYNPFPTADNLTKRRINNDYDLISASQRPHILFIPTTCQGGCLRLPFFWPNNVWDMSREAWAEMGNINIRSINVLRHAMGSTENVSVTVFAWLEDSDVAIPTEFMSGNAVPQADEHAGVVSRPAGIIAALAGRLASVCPPIAPYCLPVVEGASMVGNVAKVFGYSKPIELRQTVMVPRIKETFATTDGMDSAVKLSVDSKQGLTIDPRTVGLGSQDEMDINYIASKESYLTSFNWAHANALEDRLWSSVVDPCIHGQSGEELHFPAMCYAAMPFENWRGSIKFRFQIACSAMHKGRLRIVWDPEGISPTAGYNTAYATIIDISHTTDYTMTVGWGQSTTYREHFTPEDLEDDMYGSPTFYQSSNTTIGNGVLSVYVLNNLMSPGTLSTPVSVNVFVSGGDDLEFAAPDGRYINRLRVSTVGAIPTAKKQPKLPGAKVTIAQIGGSSDDGGGTTPPKPTEELTVEYQKTFTQPWFDGFAKDHSPIQATDVLYYAATSIANSIEGGLIPVVPTMPNVYNVIIDAGGSVTKAAANYWKLTVWKDDTSALNPFTIHDFLKSYVGKTTVYAGNEWDKNFDLDYMTGYTANADVGFAKVGQTFVAIECFNNYARHPDNVFPPIGVTVAATPEAVEAENDEGDTVGQTQPWKDGTNYIHYGETIKSFRNLVKRYNRHEIIPMNDTIAAGTIRVQSFERTSLPFEPGYTDTTITEESIPYLLSRGKYAYGYMTLVRYLTLGYGGWRGGMRYVYEMPPACCALNGVAVTRCASCANENKSTDVAVPLTGSLSGATGRLMNLYDDSSGQEGEAIFRQEINPLVSFEVPYYSIRRFSPGKTTTDFATNSNSGEPSFKVRYTKSSKNEPLGVIRTHVAAAEDFNLFMFLGAPVFYYETGSPTS